MTCTGRVIGGWTNQSEYDKLVEWIRPNRAFFDKARGISYINGNIYYADIVFIEEEDALICKLMFPTLVQIYV
jgi:hypothetical protein